MALAPVAEQLLPERGVSIAQRPVDHDQRLQSDLPSFCENFVTHYSRCAASSRKEQGRSNAGGFRDMAMAAYHPVVGLGEAPGERVDAVGDVGERAGGGRGGEDR